MKNSFITPGIPDEFFVRGNVPMTKEEVRIISLCKLRLDEKSVLYDIGSGTGSISVEAGRLSQDIRVFALETNEEAVKLTEQNVTSFGLNNVQVIKTMAPEGLENLPPATHAFIGGSKGKLKEILSALYKINPSMRVVFNSVSLESTACINEALKEFPVEDISIIQAGISRIKEAGSHRMFEAQNPVMIFSFSFKKAE